MSNPGRFSNDLSAYPDLVVIYLGMQANSLRGYRTLMQIRPEILKTVSEKPDGLLFHQDITFSLFPLHVGMRQYWRDFESLEKFARSNTNHTNWWKSFMRETDTKGVGFWHEAYSMRGGMESVFINMHGQPQGMQAFAPAQPAVGSMYSSRRRLARTGEASVPTPINEGDYLVQERT